MAGSGGDKTSIRRQALTVLVLAAAVALLDLPLLRHGPLPQGSDIYATCHYLQGFSKALSEGDLLPRWTDRTNQDLGAPSFVLFPPLAFYGAAAASAISGSVLGGLKLYLVGLAAAIAIAFYRLAREWAIPGCAAAVASAVYLLLPYHVLDRYQRFALSESTSFLFFPLILLFARRAREDRGRWSVAGLALAYAGLVLTHLVSGFLFSLFLGPWLLWEGRKRWTAGLRPLLGLALGLGLAAFVLVPAAIEKSGVNIAWVREMPNGDFRRNFLFRDDPLPGLGYRAPIKQPVLESAHAQLLLAATAAALAWTGLPRADRRRRSDIAVLAAGAVAAYLIQIPIATPVWELVPELATVQFPWRFQTIQVLTASLLVALALGALPAGRRRVPALALIALALGVNLILSWRDARLKPFSFDAVAIQDPGVLYWTEPSLTPTAFLPYRELKGMSLDLPRAAFLAGEGSVRVSSWTSSRRVLEVSGTGGGTVRLRSFWFPGWTGWIGGQPLALRPSTPYGLVTFAVPPGTSTVELRFQATPVRRLAAGVSLAAIAATAATGWRRPRQTAREASRP